MIKRLKVVGMNGRTEPIDLKFHKDMNILTGKNGSGKTSVLKLLWYLISGNLERIVPELVFEHAEITTDTFSLSVKIERIEDSERTTPTAPRTTHPRSREEVVTWELNVPLSLEHEPTELQTDLYGRPVSPARSAKPRNLDALGYLNRQVVQVSGSSVFFPTFRRIEGGFSMSRSRIHGAEDYRVKRSYYPDGPGIERAMGELSTTLSVAEHRFVASISTNDIVDVLTKQYADISEQTNKQHTKLSESITLQIQQYSQRKGDATSELDDARSVLEQIQREVTENARMQEALLKPFSVLSQLIADIFQHKGIRVTTNVTLGEANNAIASDILSAGEKQMLSFLSYNAFARNSVIFIDEPELSLHVDWQRMLFSVLLSQATENQFIVATHSPFIYSKYPDKELLLDRDRGGE